MPDLSRDEIRHALLGISSIIGREVLFFETTGSTNTVALECGEKGSPEGTLVVADTQTEGRGRLGREWVSPPKSSLAMSIILRPALPPRDAPFLTLMAGVAVASALRGLFPVPFAVKWPNDIVVSSRKVGGILTEAKSEGGKVLYAVVGIGININCDTDAFPHALRGLATSIKQETGTAHSRIAILREVVKELDAWYKVLLAEGKQPIIERWTALSCLTGHQVRVSLATHELEGIVEGIDADGMLLVRLPDDTIARIHSGEVTLLRNGL